MNPIKSPWLWAMACLRHACSLPLYHLPCLLQLCYVLSTHTGGNVLNCTRSASILGNKHSSALLPSQASRVPPSSFWDLNAGQIRIVGFNTAKNLMASQFMRQDWKFYERTFSIRNRRERSAQRKEGKPKHGYGPSRERHSSLFLQ